MVQEREQGQVHTISERRLVECSLRLMMPCPSWCLLRRLEKVLSSLSTFGPESTLASSFQNGSLGDRRVGLYRTCCSEKEMVDWVLWPLTATHWDSAGMCVWFGALPPPSIHHPESPLWQQITLKTYDQDHKVTDHSVLMLGSSRLCSESCCTASWWAAFTLCATHTVYCRGSRSILGNDWRQNCCLLSNPSCSGISGDMSTATPAWWEEKHEKNRMRRRPWQIPIDRHNVTEKGMTRVGEGAVSADICTLVREEKHPPSPPPQSETRQCVC